MGFRADFYLERGIDAVWLGSLRKNGAPKNLERVLYGIDNSCQYLRAVRFAVESGDGVLPSEGWPWPYKSSHDTDYTYTFAGKKLWVSCYGSPWVHFGQMDFSSVADDYDFDAVLGLAPILPRMATVGAKHG